jgi:acyl-CoA reductase-like NAD-dependent aldehyde dehydrogenase
MVLLVIKVAPALLADDTVVAKPAPTTPLTTLLFGEICAEILPAGNGFAMPPGLVNKTLGQGQNGGRSTRGGVQAINSFPPPPGPEFAR